MNDVEFEQFCERYMCRNGRLVPARLQAAIGLLERLRDHPSLELASHLSSGGNGLKSHETIARRALERYKLEAVNKNSGRRSSNISEWGKPLLDAVRTAGFERDAGCLSVLQDRFAEPLRSILESEPLSVRLRGRSAEAVVAELLEQADERGKAGAVAQYLVGAKLQLRFPEADIPIHPYNKGDRRHRGDEAARLADFELAEAAIEVALGTPDEKHLDQIQSVLEESDSEVWLLVRSRRAQAWQTEIDLFEASLRHRVVVASIEAFVGQNVTELGAFSAKGKREKLVALFGIYNDIWIDKLGPPSLRIIVK